MATTGERIREARIKAGLTQSELASMIGVKFSAIHKYETGLIVNLKRDTIAKLAKALNVRPSYLLCVDEESTDPELDEILEQMKTRPEMRMLFKLSANATAEDVRQAIRIIEAIRKEE